MVIRCDAAFFRAMRDAGYDIDRKRLIEIYAQAKAMRQAGKSKQAQLEEAGQERMVFDDIPSAA